jgi:hypothetical protein
MAAGEWADEANGEQAQADGEQAQADGEEA